MELAAKAKYIAGVLTGSSPGVNQANHAVGAAQLSGRKATRDGLRRYWQLLPIAVAFGGLDSLEKFRAGARAAGLADGRIDQRISAGLTGSLDVRMNQWTSAHILVAAPAAVYYIVAQVLVTGTVAILLLRAERPSFRLHRDALVVCQAIGLAVFWLCPVAPPRMLPEYHDTVAGVLPFFSAQVETHTADQYAAFPSLHVAWAIWVAVVLQSLLRRRAWRAVAWGYPALTAADVLATANHYSLDVLAAPVVLALAYALAAESHALGRALPRRRPRAPAVPAITIAMDEDSEAA